MKRIAMVLPTIDQIGGAERQVLLLICGLNTRGWCTSLVTLSGDGGDAASALAADGVSHFSLRMRKGLADPRGWWRFQQWLREQRPDIVHAHLPPAAWLARWSCLFYSRTKVVDTIHTSSPGTLGRRYGYKLSDRLAHLVTAVSETCANAYAERNMVSPQHLRIIPNGIDLSAWQPDICARNKLRSELSIERRFLWLAAGRLDSVKDYPTLLHAFALLDESSQLLIAGTGRADTELRALSRHLNIETRVRFLGFQKDLGPWMHAADGFIQTSLWEGLPMAILEASACGLPTVATDVAGTRDVVRPGVNGLLAPAKNAIAISEAMRTIMQMPKEERAQMGHNARRIVLDSYSLDRVLDLWDSTYAEMLR